MQTTPTKLSIQRWARIMGINPLHFNGVTITEMSQSLGCSTPWFQWPWQSADRTGRDDIARAIAEAESDIEHLIGYRLKPSWEADEWQATPRPYRKEMVNLSNTDIRGYGLSVPLNWGYFITGGVRAKAALATEVSVVYTNTKPPASYDDEASVSFTLLEEVPDCEVFVIYPGYGGDEQWCITDVAVSHIGLAYTATFHREQCVLPDLFDSFDTNDLRGVDGLDDANFLETVDIYRIYNDPSQQATMLWEPLGGCPVCNGATVGACSSCGYAAQTACLIAKGDPRLAQVAYSPGVWDADTQGFSRYPLAAGRAADDVRLWYYAGYRENQNTQGWPGDVSPCVNNEMAGDWATIVAHLAASKLERPPCACTTTKWEHWSGDLAFAGGATELAVYRLRDDELGNPIGTRRGAVEAWRRIKRPGAVIGRVAVSN